MTIEEKIRKLEFLNLFHAKSGSFVIDISKGACGYRDRGAVFPVPDEYIEQLFDITIASAKLTQRRHELDAQYLDGAIVRKYDKQPEPINIIDPATVDLAGADLKDDI